MLEQKLKQVWRELKEIWKNSPQGYNKSYSIFKEDY